MKLNKYVDNLVEKFGEVETKEQLQRSLEHHKIQHKIHKHEKTSTTVKFFQNALNYLENVRI